MLQCWLSPRQSLGVELSTNPSEWPQMYTYYNLTLTIKQLFTLWSITSRNALCSMSIEQRKGGAGTVWQASIGTSRSGTGGHTKSKFSLSPCGTLVCSLARHHPSRCIPTDAASAHAVIIRCSCCQTAAHTAGVAAHTADASHAYVVHPSKSTAAVRVARENSRPGIATTTGTSSHQ